MSTATRNDPVTAFCFRVELTLPTGSLGEAYFKSVSGLKSESEVTDYKEGGVNTSTRRLVGPAKWPNIVLKKGFMGTVSQPLLDWRYSWLNDGATALVRVTGKIVQLNSQLDPVCSWRFVRGWPCKWEGPEYDATKQELAIETIEIAHEGLVFEPPKKNH